MLFTYLNEQVLVRCTAVILGQTKSLDFLEEKKNMKSSRSEAGKNDKTEAGAQNKHQTQQQFQSVSLIHRCLVFINVIITVHERGVATFSLVCIYTAVV